MSAVESLTERVLLLETLNQRQAAQIQSMTEQITVTMQSHQAIHEEVKRIPTGGSGSGYKGQVDKLLLPERYHGEKEKWRMFSSKLMSCLGKTHPPLREAMAKEMGRSRPISAEQLKEYNLTDEAQECLSEQLTALLMGGGLGGD